MEQNLQKIKRDRILWMDVLNVIATMGVIILHSSNDQVHSWNGIIDPAYIWGCFTHTVMIWPVPIFLMLSGCNLIGYRGEWRNFYIRRLKRIGIPFIIWSVFYMIVYFLMIYIKDKPLECWQEYITMFINGEYNGHMWFFVSLFALYLTIPFLNAFFKAASEQTIKLLVLFSFFFCSLLPFFFALFEIEYFNNAIFPLGANLLFYGYWGYILVKTELLNSHALYYKLGICSAIIHFIIMIVLMNDFDREAKVICNYQTPTCALISIAVFLWFKHQNWDKLLMKIHIRPELIQKISTCSFGIFLLHNFVMRVFNLIAPALCNRYFGFIIVYAVSLYCILIMKRIPIIRNIVP